MLNIAKMPELFYMDKKFSNKTKTTITIGPTFLELLTIIFIVLKLQHKIDWSWVWVLAPIWIPIALLFIVFAICIIVPIIILIIKRFATKRKY